MSALLDIAKKWGVSYLRLFLPGIERHGKHEFRVSVPDRLLNTLLPRVLDKEKVKVRFLPDRLRIEGSKVAMGIDASVAVTLGVSNWHLTTEQAIFEFTPDGPIEKSARGLVGKVVLFVLTALWGADTDEEIYRAAVARSAALEWNEGKLRCDLDKVPEIRKYLRHTEAGIQPLSVLKVQAVELQDHVLGVVLGPTPALRRVIDWWRQFKGASEESRDRAWRLFRKKNEGQEADRSSGTATGPRETDGHPEEQKDEQDDDQDRKRPWLCRLRHSWGNWTYDVTTGCVQSRGCRRCGQTKSRTRHVWPAWEYLDAGSCSQARRCTRCSEVEEQARHEWGPWTHMEPGSCDRARSCSRCGAADTAVLHDYGPWLYEAPDTCHKVATCDRCGEKKRSLLKKHQWGEWVHESPGSCKLVKFCRRCNERKRGDLEHSWIVDATERRCERCGESEE